MIILIILLLVYILILTQGHSDIMYYPAVQVHLPMFDPSIGRKQTTFQLFQQYKVILYYFKHFIQAILEIQSYSRGKKTQGRLCQDRVLKKIPVFLDMGHLNQYKVTGMSLKGFMATEFKKILSSLELCQAVQINNYVYTIMDLICFQ